MYFLQKNNQYEEYTIKNISNSTITNILSILLGIVVFFSIFGYKILDPTFIAWTMHGDGGQHFLGWHFFRFDSWDFPIGTIHDYHYPSGTNLVYMDAIPLIAIPLKLFSNLLPNIFQYHGLWMLTVYILQSLFASLLLSVVTKNRLLILLGVTFFTLSTTMLDRTVGHESLSAHWLILASMYLYFSCFNKASMSKWLGLIIISSMVHFYLLFIVLVMWSAYLLNKFLEDKKRILTIAIYFIVSLVLLLLTMWIIGYFAIPFDDVSVGGTGHFSMNMLSPINPMSKPTTFFENIPSATGGQYEGYNYLGLGVILLGIFSLYEIIKVRKTLKWKLYVPLILVVVGTYIFALSNKITFADEVIFTYDIAIVNFFLELLRSSGRIFWVGHYIILFVVIASIVRHKRTYISVILLVFGLVVQIIDFYPMYSRYNNLGDSQPNYSLQSKTWDAVAKNIDNIALIPAEHSISDPHNIFALYAANNNLTINTGYVARENISQMHKYKQEIISNFLSGNLDKKTLYIIKDGYLNQPKKLSPYYMAGKLDGYNIVMPKNDNINLSKLNLELSYFYPFDSNNIQFVGWTNPFNNHRISIKKRTKIIFDILDPENIKGKLKIVARTLGKQDIIIFFNKKRIGQTTIKGSFKLGVNLPKKLLKKKNNVLKFIFPKPNRTRKNNIYTAIAIHYFSIK